MTYIDRLTKLNEHIGNTTLVKLTFEYNNIKTEVFAKEEFLNPSGSIKIRPAYQILLDAITSGKLKEGQRVVEVTSGNMGIALAYLCKEIGNPITILMPKTMSEERKQILRDLGADIVLTDDFISAFALQKEYEKNGAFLTRQFENTSNTKAHERTAQEFLDKLNDYDGFVSGVGTGGTLIGCGGFLKEKLDCKLIAIEPKESGLLINGISKGKHKIQGLSDQIIPALYNNKSVDEIIEIASDDAIVMAQRIKEKFNLGIGISSGANILGAILSNCSNVATVFADNDEKYKSTDLFNNRINSELVDQIKLISCEEVK